MNDGTYDSDNTWKRGRNREKGQESIPPHHYARSESHNDVNMDTA